MSVILQMEEGYPNISSGTICFENVRSGKAIAIKAPGDLKANSYGVKSIVMDSGAGYTVFPVGFADKVDVEPPSKGREDYYIFSGVGGTSVGFVSTDRILVRIEGNRGRVERTIYPFFLMKYAPSITSEGRLLTRPAYQPHTEEILPFVSPPFRYGMDTYVVEVCSPDKEFGPEGRRLELEVNTGEEMDYILIGRDWQKGFQLTFRAEEMLINENGK